jgi:HAD superfamily hydrolase (TIGR01509 family)
MKFDALIFDFDGVLIESEYVSNVQIADVLTHLGHPTTIEEAIAKFTGLGGKDFLDAVAHHIGGDVPDAFYHARKVEDERVLRDGLDAVAGAIAFVSGLPEDMPRAIASSSTTHWIRTHLQHIGLTPAFDPHIYSGREHVARGKPAPDIYLHAADALGVSIARSVIIEDSPVGVTGAVASGAWVIGLAAGQHCADGHDAKLRAQGAHEIAYSFEDVAELIG